jgi:cytochrome c peroxidase
MRAVTSWLLLASVAVLACGTGTTPTDSIPAPASSSSSIVTIDNGSGIAQTVNASGGPVVDLANPFFQSLGTNGRTCATCHDVRDNMTVTPQSIQARFAATGGTDPIFRTVDGSNSPLADVSTVDARLAAYSMLLSKGLIRVGIGIPAITEFDLVAVQDPYGYASAAELSLFRRPLPATNLKFLSTVMFDGRETFKDPTQPTGFAPLTFDLADQSNGATLGHAQAATPLTDAQRQAIVAFETQLFTAQVEDDVAGDLDRAGATGGPRALSGQPFTFGMNDPLNGGPFDPVVMTEFSAWNGSPNAARASVARGEDLFNGRTLLVTGVSGLNDDLGVQTIQGTCTLCHDTPHAGDHSVPAPLRIGTDLPQPAGPLDVSGLPLYTLRNRVTGETKVTTDPGRALITGRWKDVGRFKGPILRGLAGRAPYFHNGSAPNLAAVVEFYDQRFSIGLTASEKADLVAFLRSL